MIRMTMCCAMVVLACLSQPGDLLAGALESQEAIEVGPEIWVDGPANVLNGSGSNDPHVAVDEFGNRVYVWEVGFTTGGDRDDVYMRRFDAAGSPLGDPVMVNTLIDEAQQLARVATSSDGSFLVIWESSEPSAVTPTVDRARVRSQAFDGDGNKVGNEQLLSTVSPENNLQLHLDVAALRVTDGSPGGYVAVWESWTPNGTDTGTNIQARLVSPNGSPFGAQFQANTTISGVATAAGGRRACPTAVSSWCTDTRTGFWASDSTPRGSRWGPISRSIRSSNPESPIRTWS